MQSLVGNWRGVKRNNWSEMESFVAVMWRKVYQHLCGENSATRARKVLLGKERSLSCPTSFLWNPQEWKMAEAPVKISIPVMAYFSGILALQNQDQNAPQNGQERNATGIRWPKGYFNNQISKNRLLFGFVHWCHAHQRAPCHHSPPLHMSPTDYDVLQTCWHDRIRLEPRGNTARGQGISCTPENFCFFF